MKLFHVKIFYGLGLPMKFSNSKLIPQYQCIGLMPGLMTTYGILTSEREQRNSGVKDGASIDY